MASSLGLNHIRTRSSSLPVPTSAVGRHTSSNNVAQSGIDRTDSKLKLHSPEKGKRVLWSQSKSFRYPSTVNHDFEDKGLNEIVFKAMGRAITKTVTIVELIKRRIVGLHKILKWLRRSTDMTDTWEPLEEGLLLY